ncbi:hypothetical protein PROFUN_02171 [Planoprotostelium fungivorum]|uniref:Clu domain-containing protein n=1 Tax=Planoprotostelium fungivorum TaxID=1890364 RepID=A0A2P6NZB8_9EUKA|nr:hypothetical protein PROFUN_02171 [Planoprotostelium fungivorum]
MRDILQTIRIEKNMSSISPQLKSLPSEQEKESHKAGQRLGQMRLLINRGRRQQLIRRLSRFESCKQIGVPEHHLVSVDPLGHITIISEQLSEEHSSNTSLEATLSIHGVSGEDSEPSGVVVPMFRFKDLIPKNILSHGSMPKQAQRLGAYHVDEDFAATPDDSNFKSITDRIPAAYWLSSSYGNVNRGTGYASVSDLSSSGISGTSSQASPSPTPYLTTSFDSTATPPTAYTYDDQIKDRTVTSPKDLSGDITEDSYIGNFIESSDDEEEEEEDDSYSEAARTQSPPHGNRRRDWASLTSPTPPPVSSMSQYNSPASPTDGSRLIESLIHSAEVKGDKVSASIVRRMSQIDNLVQAKQELRDWNEDYRKVKGNVCFFLGQSNGRMKDLLNHTNWSAGSSLAWEFAETAALYARIIISELFLHPDKRTFPTADVGGVAGGRKFIVKNILFKMAGDTLLCENPKIWMYGGAREEPDHVAAAKAAKNEMQGLEAMSNTYVSGLSFPMMTMIDYKGFRLLAMPVLPIDKTTLKYGSNDAGATIHADDEVLNEKIEEACRRLNLRAHTSGLREDKKVVYGPGDMEGHVGLDGNLYVIDFGRMMPPEAPIYSTSKNKRSIFYNLLPAHLVRSNPEPLCSDAFTKWNSTEDLEERKEIEDQVTRATKRLYEECIPKMAENLDSMVAKFCDMDEQWAVDVLEGRGQIEELGYMLSVISPIELHKHSCNVRHLGRIRSLCKSPLMRKLILSVCAARVAKDDIRELFKLKTFEISAPSHHPYRKVIIKFFNQLHGHSKGSKKYWNTLIRRIQDKFDGCLTPEEQENFDLRNHLDLRMVYLVIIKCTGIVLTPAGLEALSSNEDFRFVEADIMRMDPVIKFQSQVYLWGSLSLLQSTVNMEDKKKIKPRELIRQLTAAEEYLSNAYSLSPTCPLINLSWAYTMIRLNNAKGSYDQCEIKRINEMINTVLGDKSYLERIRAEAYRCYAKGVEPSDPKQAKIALENAAKADEKAQMMEQQKLKVTA